MTRLRRPRLRLAFGALVVALAGAGAFAAWSAHAPERGPAALPALESLGEWGRVPPFTLTERSGRRVSLDDLRGLVWVADFIYTECTDTCPAQSLRMAALQREFADAADLRLVSFSVDPVHDTPEALRRYAARYRADERWLFLTGDAREIHCLAREGFRLGVVDAAAPVECGRLSWLRPARAWAHHPDRRPLIHSERFVLVDRQTRIRAYHRTSDPASLEALRANLRALLAEPAGAPVSQVRGR